MAAADCYGRINGNSSVPVVGDGDGGIWCGRPEGTSESASGCGWRSQEPLVSESGLARAMARSTQGSTGDEGERGASVVNPSAVGAVEAVEERLQAQHRHNRKPSG